MLGTSLNTITFATLAFLGLSFCSPPAPAKVLQSNVTVKDSKPFIHQSERECLALNMYFEARNQEWQGIVAVGLVTLNRVADSRFPDTPCEVVYQGPTSRWWYEKHGKIVPIRHRCQFSWFCDGKSDIVPKHDQELWHSILTLSGEMIGSYNWGSLYDITKGSTHYHADYVYPEWRREKTKTITIGNHIFYRWEKR
tara:strand:+ start:94 stop:681 length:588 start_codon:yes stop_codon:yes gene_type:complete